MYTLFDDGGHHKRKVDWRLFLLFLIVCLLIGILLIYWIFPGYISKEKIERIPIIIDENPGEVRGIPGEELMI